MLRGLPGAARVLKGLNATRSRGLGPAGFVPAHRLRSTAAENSSAAVTTSQSGFPASPPWQRVKYAELEVWDSAELVALSAHLVSERARLHEVYRVAKLEQRKVAAAERRRETSRPPPSRLTCTPPAPLLQVLWKDAQFDLRRLDRLEGWIETIKRDTRRTW